MKILFLTSAFPSVDYPNSNAHNFRSIKQLKTIADIDVIHLRSWKPWRRIWNCGTFEGVKVITFSLLFLPINLLLLKGLNLMIYKIAFYHFFKMRCIEKYDVIHTAGISMESVVGAYLSKKTGIKHIAQVMGSDMNISIPKTINKLGWRSFSKNIDLIICNSEDLKKSTLKYFKNTLIKTVYRGIDLQEFKYSPYIIDKSSPLVFLYLGGFVTSKGFELNNYKGAITLIKAWIKLFQELSTSSIELHIGGPYVSIEFIESLIKASVKQYNIRVIGQLERSKVGEAMEKSSVIVIPSFSEGLPNVAVEAAAIGRPVIASKVGGLPEIVVENETGLLFDCGDENSLSSCIKKYYLQPDLIWKHGFNARQHVEQNFNFEDFVNQYNKFYEQLLRGCS